MEAIYLKPIGCTPAYDELGRIHCTRGPGSTRARATEDPRHNGAERKLRERPGRRNKETRQVSTREKGVSIIAVHTFPPRGKKEIRTLVPKEKFRCRMEEKWEGDERSLGWMKDTPFAVPRNSAKRSERFLIFLLLPSRIVAGDCLPFAIGYFACEMSLRSEF